MLQRNQSELTTSRRAASVCVSMDLSSAGVRRVRSASCYREHQRIFGVPPSPSTQPVHWTHSSISRLCHIAWGSIRRSAQKKYNPWELTFSFGDVPSPSATRSPSPLAAEMPPRCAARWCAKSAGPWTPHPALRPRLDAEKARMWVWLGSKNDILENGKLDSNLVCFVALAALWLVCFTPHIASLCPRKHSQIIKTLAETLIASYDLLGNFWESNHAPPNSSSNIHGWVFHPDERVRCRSIRLFTSKCM